MLKGGTLPSINTFVDLYNVLSLKHLLPVGGEDLDRCTGDIILDRATGTEPFIALGETENEPPEAGEIVYKDNEITHPLRAFLVTNPAVPPAAQAESSGRTAMPSPCADRVR